MLYHLLSENYEFFESDQKGIYLLYFSLIYQTKYIEILNILTSYPNIRDFIISISYINIINLLIKQCYTDNRYDYIYTIYIDIFKYIYTNKLYNSDEYDS